jgi:hypothetical protein
MAPSEVNNHADHPYFHMLSLPRKCIRLRVTHPMRGVSMLDRCTGESTKAPDLGTYSLPSKRARQKV